ncbi:MAG: PASTA domain-containing protein [Planctomycetota bacterium]
MSSPSSADTVLGLAIGAGGNPFVGLRPFEQEDAPYFFGRRQQTAELLERLREASFLAVVGSSGCGKSSLIRAGLVPAVLGGFLVEDRDRWLIGKMRPGDAPLRNLAAALLESIGDGEPEPAAVDALKQAIEQDHTDAVIRLVTEHLADDTNHLLLVDQFEEIFAFRGTDDGVERKRGKKERRRRAMRRREAADFVNLLIDLGSRPDVPIYVVLTMRTDFLGDCDVFYGLPEAMNRSRYLVPRLTRSDLREAIEGPVLLSGAELAPRLLDHLLNDLGDRMDRLPVLQHALLRSWDRWKRTADGGLIDLEHYEAIGGLNGALSMHAEEALQGCDRAAAARVFRCLTDVDGSHRRVRRPSTMGELCDATGLSRLQVTAIIRAFEEGNRHFVYVSKGAVEGDERVDISHESLIRQWGRLRDWVDEELESADRFRELVRLARREKADGLTRSLVNPELQIALAWREEANPTQGWATRYSEQSDDFGVALSFLERSKKEFVRSRVVRFSFLGAVVAGFAALFVAIALASGRARDAADRAEMEALAADEQRQLAEASALTSRDQARVALASEWIEKDPTRAALVLLELEQPEDNRYAASTMHAALGQPFARRSLRGHDQPVLDAEFDPTGERVVTASHDGTARLWEVRSGEVLAVLGAHGGSVLAAAFDPRGHWLATASEDSTVCIWDARTGQLLRRLEGHGQAVVGLDFSPDGERLVTVSRDTTARLWRWATDEEQPALLEGHDDILHAARFDAYGALIVTGSEDGRAGLWDGFSGKWQRDLEASGSAVLALDVDPFRQWVVTGGADGLAYISETEFGEVVTVLDGHTRAIRAVAFDPEGELVVTASDDRTAKVWDAYTGERIATLTGHLGPVRSASFNSDGSWVLTSSDDGTARIWESRSGDLVYRLKGHERAVVAAAFDPDGKRAVTASEDGTARIWSPPPDELKGHRAGILSMSFDPAAERLVTAARDGTARIWDIASRSELHALEEAELDLAWVSPSSDLTFATSRSSELVRLLDGKGNTLWSRPAPSGVIHVAFHEATGKIAYSDYQDEVTIIRAPDDITTLSSPVYDLAGLNFNADGTELRFVTRSSQVLGWSIEGNEQVGSRPDEGYGDGFVYETQFSDDGRRFLTIEDGPDGLLAVVHTIGEGDAKHLHQASGTSSRYALSGDGSRLAVWSERRLEVLDVDSKTTVAEFKVDLRDGEVFDVALDRAGDRLAVSRANGTVEVLAVDSEPSSIAVLSGAGRVEALWLSPDGSRVTSFSRDGLLVVREVETGRVVGRAGGRISEEVEASFVEGGAKVLTLDGGGGVRLWDVETGARLAWLGGDEADAYRERLMGGSGADPTPRIFDVEGDGTADIYRARFGHEVEGVLAAAFNGDDVRVLTSDDVATRVLDQNAQEVTRLNVHDVDGAAFCDDGSCVVTASGKFAMLWNASNGRRLAVIEEANPLVAVALSPDGQRILTAAEDPATGRGTARVWDAETELELLELAHSGAIHLAFFSPDGLRVVTSWGRTARIWPVSAGLLEERIRGATDLTLSDGFRRKYSDVLLADAKPDAALPAAERKAPKLAERPLPKLTGLPLGEAESVAGGAGFVTVTLERVLAPGKPGTILRQTPAAGVSVLEGSRVALLVAAEPFLPDVTGSSLPDARARLGQLGLRVDVRLADNGELPGMVLAQKPEPGPVDGENRFDVALSVQRRSTKVPDVKTLGVDEAKRLLAEAHLTPRAVDVFEFGAPGLVKNQKPDPWSSVPYGTEVKLDVSWRPPMVRLLPEDTLATLWIDRPAELWAELRGSSFGPLLRPGWNELADALRSSYGLDLDVLLSKFGGELVGAFRMKNGEPEWLVMANVVSTLEVQRELEQAKEELAEMGYAFELLRRGSRGGERSETPATRAYVHVESGERLCYLSYASDRLFLSNSSEFLGRASGKAARSKDESPESLPDTPLLAVHARHREAGSAAFLHADLAGIAGNLRDDLDRDAQAFFESLAALGIDAADLGLGLDDDARSVEARLFLPRSRSDVGPFAAFQVPPFDLDRMAAVPESARAFLSLVGDPESSMEALLSIGDAVARAYDDESAGRERMKTELADEFEMTYEDFIRGLGGSFDLFSASESDDIDDLNEDWAMSIGADERLFEAMVRSIDRDAFEVGDFESLPLYGVNSDGGAGFYKGRFVFGEPLATVEKVLGRLRAGARRRNYDAGLELPDHPVHAACYADSGVMSELVLSFFSEFDLGVQYDYQRGTYVTQDTSSPWFQFARDLGAFLAYAHLVEDGVQVEAQLLMR